MRLITHTYNRLHAESWRPLSLGCRSVAGPSSCPLPLALPRAWPWYLLLLVRLALDPSHSHMRCLSPDNTHTPFLALRDRHRHTPLSHSPCSLQDLGPSSPRPHLLSSTSSPLSKLGSK